MWPVRYRGHWTQGAGLCGHPLAAGMFAVPAAGCGTGRSSVEEGPDTKWIGGAGHTGQRFEA